MVRFKIDENLPADVAKLLVASGHDALTVPDQHLSGCPDFEWANACRSEDRAIVTLDVDYANVRAYPPALFPGIAVLRLARQDKHCILSAVTRLIPVLDQELLAGKLWVVSESTVRIHD